MEDIIFDLMIQGCNCEQIDKVYEAALLAADKRYGEYKREQARKEQEEKERREKLECERMRRAEAREDLGAALLEYMKAYNYKIEDRTHDDIEAIVDALPQIKVMRYWR